MTIDFKSHFYSTSNEADEYASHKRLLYEALVLTTGSVLELGVGKCSTQSLHDYCVCHKRKLYSYESDLEWLNLFKDLECDYHKLFKVDRWVEARPYTNERCGVALVDHSWDENFELFSRREEALYLRDRCDVVIVHDVEDAYYQDVYKTRELPKAFKYSIEDTSTKRHSYALSDVIDVTRIKLNG